jgi:hypothetical protein
VADDLEKSLLAMANDPETPAHLRLGALKQLALFKRQETPARGGGPAPERDDGLPGDPLLADFPDEPDEHGRPLPPDPMADLHWAAITGRMPHPAYARALVRVPFPAPARPEPKGAHAKLLLDAEAWFLRECRNRGIDVPDPDDELDMQRWQRSQKRRKR